MFRIQDEKLSRFWVISDHHQWVVLYAYRILQLEMHIMAALKFKIELHHF
jgi:hypothetical protein